MPVSPSIAAPERRPTARSLRTRLRVLVPAAALALVVTAAGCSVEEPAADGGGGAVTVGLINSYTGPIANFGPAYEAGFRAGIAVATGGTGAVDGTSIRIEVRNDNADPATGLNAAKELLGAGAKFLVGPSSSAVAVPVAQLAMQNGATFISGETGAPNLNGMGHNVFRPNGGSPMLNAAVLESVLANGGKKIVYFGQDYAYGQDAAELIESTGQAKGIAVDSVLLPVNTQDFTPGVLQVLEKQPDVIYVGWAGAGMPQLFAALENQRVFESGTSVLALAPPRQTWPSFAAAAGANLDKITLLTSYAEGVVGSPMEKSMLDALTDSDVPVDIYQPSGFIAAQMVVRALEEAGPDLDQAAVSAALGGWQFDSPLGTLQIRAEDHLITVPEFEFTLVGNGEDYKLDVRRAFDGAAIAPPVTTPIK